MTRNNTPAHQAVAVRVEQPQSLFSGHNTYSTLFLIPAFSVYLDEATYSFFVNSYLDDREVRHQFVRPLFLLLETGDMHDATFVEVDRSLRENRNFRWTYHAGVSAEGGHLVMYVFECPEAYAPDYDKFMEARYSEFSADYKSRFNKVVPNQQGHYVESPIYGVLHKTDTLRQKIERIIGATLEDSQEFFGKWRPDYEVFRYLKTKTKTTDEPVQIQAPAG